MAARKRKRRKRTTSKGCGCPKGAKRAKNGACYKKTPSGRVRFVKKTC